MPLFIATLARGRPLWNGHINSVDRQIQRKTMVSIENFGLETCRQIHARTKRLKRDENIQMFRL
jgi:hypothetical protein